MHCFPSAFFFFLTPQTTHSKNHPLTHVFLICPCVEALTSWWVFLGSTKDVWSLRPDLLVPFAHITAWHMVASLP